MKIGNLTIAAVIIAIVMMLILPMPPMLLDTLLIISISLALIILLITLYTKETLEFSTFPSVLLIVTLFRLALNVSTTRVILLNGGEAGNVIKTFGQFVVQGNIVVGVVIFLVIIIIQFIVITKGAERVAEVAARFTLDAMPGKQMAIDADLNSGMIDEAQARVRREKIQREADFYGSMDGASKFVKGDAIVSIITALINSIGGIIIGTLAGGDIGTVASTYTIATIGDGLCGQIPALLMSTATGMVVTKAASESDVGTEVFGQIAGQPQVLMIAGAVVVLLSFIPGMPMFQMIILASFLLLVGVSVQSRRKKAELVEEVPAVEQAAEDTRKPENVVSLLQVDPIELEFGYGIIPLADISQGGDLLDRVVMIRRQCAKDLGMIVPVIRLRDNIQFASNEYMIKIKGNEVAKGEVMLDHFLAMNPGDISEPIDGIETIEPAFGLPAVWLNEQQRERAELFGYTIVDPPSVIATHLTEVIRRHAHELLGRQQVQVLIDNLKQSQPSLVDEVVPKLFSLGEVQKVLGNLLREGVSIRDMGSIIETLGDFGAMTRDPDMLTEYVRQSLKRTITGRYVSGKHMRVLTLDPELEHLILDNVKQTEHGSYIALEAEAIQKIFVSLRSAIERMTSLGISPIVLTSPVVRYHFKRLIEQMVPDLVVLSYNEIEQDVDIQADGIVTIQK